MIVVENTEHNRPTRKNDGFGVIWVERFEDGQWYAAVYWTQLPAYPHQGTRPTRYGRGALGETRGAAIENIAREMGLTMP